jgi:hypothetical protein
MAIEIREVKTRGDLRTFIKVPFRLYKGCSQWVPPLLFDELKTLLKDKNPAFESCTAKYWVAFRDGEPVGRIAGIINHAYVQRWKTARARFGWIDFIDDRSVSEALYGTVERWARSEGMSSIHGPLGFTDMDREGMLVEGFEELGTMATNYNYPYYPVHTEALGYAKDTDWLEFEIKVPQTIPEKALRIAEITMQRRGLHMLAAKKAKDFLPYAHQIFEIINQTYGELYGFVPLTDKQIDLYVKQYIPNVVPDYLKVILDGTDTVAGFVIAMPSLSRALQRSKGRIFPFGFVHLLRALRRPRYLDLYLGAIRPDLQGKGADALLITELAKSCINNHIISAESNLELEDNVLVQGHWKYFERRQHKRRRCYLKEFS